MVEPARSEARNDTGGHRLGMLLLLLLVLFGATATWSPPYVVDAYTNALQARAFADDGSPIIEEADHLTAEKYAGELVWIVESPRGTVAQYPPGVMLWTAPFYLLDTSLEPVDAEFSNAGVPEAVSFESPSLVPAALAAITAATLAMAFFGLTLRGRLSERATLTAVSVAALGTGTWSIAANMSWQHGPAMMAISAGVLLASRDRFAASGVAFAFALLIRPHTAVIAAAVGLFCAVKRRQLRPLFGIGIPSLLGLAALVAYNDWLWGSPSLAGGYGGSFAERATTQSPFLVLPGRMFASVFDPTVGMAWTSPFLLLGFWAMVSHRKAAPDWAKGAALGGLGYLLIQYQANRVSGGVGFFSYRYPLEALMAAAPMMAMTLRSWAAEDRLRQRLFMVAAGAAVAAHGFGAITT